MAAAEAITQLQTDEHGMGFIDLVQGECSARIYAHGAHVTSWKVKA